LALGMGTSGTLSYLSKLASELFHRVVSESGESIEKAARLVAEAMKLGGLEYVFGTGHSMLVALEASFRAGELVRVYPIVDLSMLGIPSALRASALERLPGYSKAIVSSLRIVPNSVAIIVSNSGKNSGPVEMALELRSRGVKTVGVTSLEYSRKLVPDNPATKKLYEVVDVVIDNKVPDGDAAYELSQRVRVFPVSTIVNSFIVHLVNARAAEILMEQGFEPEVWTSVNVPGGKERNSSYIEKYFSVLRFL